MSFPHGVPTATEKIRVLSQRGEESQRGRDAQVRKTRDTAHSRVSFSVTGMGGGKGDDGCFLRGQKDLSVKEQICKNKIFRVIFYIYQLILR
jgi:hypothetical protein